MNKENLVKFYQLVKEARESCAGDSIKPFKFVIHYLNKALRYGSEHSMSSVYLERIAKAKGLLVNAKDYGDRLEPDDILCQVCNELLKELESK